MGKKVIIIGGGLGGMSAAIHLALDNYDVTILEKNERLGGKLNKRGGKGFLFDTGPSILMMPWVLEELFQNANRRLSDYITINRIEPQVKAFFEDGATIQLTSDLPEMINQLESVSEHDASELFHYLNYCRKMYECSAKTVFKNNISNLHDLRSMLSVKELLSLDLLKTMNQGTKKFFTNNKVQQLFNYLSLLYGSSSYRAPASLSQLAHIQLGTGIYYVKGGLYKIADALARLLHEIHVNVYFNTNVKRIISSDFQAKGVELENGRILEADIVISNLEAIPTYRTLLQEYPLPTQIKNELDKFPPTVSAFICLLGVNKSYPNIAHHNLFFSKSPEKEYQQIFKEGVPADDPTIYVGISCKSDPTQAPSGKENMVLLAHVPPLHKNEDWTKKEKEYREIILSKLERMGISNLRDHIEYEDIITPNQIQLRYGSNGGSLYGVETDRKRNNGLKINNRSSLLNNLYFSGGSTNPGGSIPLVILSGKLTANLILNQDIKSNRGIS